MSKKVFVTMAAALMAILMIYSVSAQFGGDGTNAFAPSEQGTENPDYSDAAFVNNLNPADLSAAILKGDITDMSVVQTENLALAINAQPAIVEKLDNADLIRSINYNPSLLGKDEVFNKLDSEAANDVSILNDNPKIKEGWFNKFGITDKGAAIKTYDGLTATTNGINGNTFTITDFPGATVLSDGSLITGKGTFTGTKELHKILDANGADTGKYFMKGGELSGLLKTKRETFQVKDKKGNPVFKNGQPVYEVRDRYSGFSVNDMKIEDGKIVLPYSKARVVEYNGDFSVDNVRTTIYNTHTLDVRIKSSSDKGFLRTVKNSLVEDVNNQKISEFKINGNVFETYALQGGGLIVGGGVTETRMHSTIDGTSVAVRSANGIYYHEELNGDVDNRYCAIVSCMLNFPSESGHRDFRSVLKTDVKGSDKITFSGPVYFSKVETTVEGKTPGKLAGSFNYVSTDNNNLVLSDVLVGPSGDVRTRGRLSETNTGRFDVYYKGDNDEKLLKHWSSNKFMKQDRISAVSRFFGKRHESFVTCELGFNCDEKFAKNFGVAIGPPSPETLMIVSGDNAYTAQHIANSENCKRNGCYILNSRDMPDVTTAEKLVITGHHWSPRSGDRTLYVWRDAPPGKKGNHVPIDRMPLTRLPKGEISEITFSACNTLLSDNHVVLNTLKGQYDNSLKKVAGQSGIAPLYQDYESSSVEDSLKALLEHGPYVHRSRSENSGKLKEVGRRAVAFLYKDTWCWTDGEDYIPKWCQTAALQ